VSFNPVERDQELCRNIVEAYGFIERYINGLNENEFLMDAKTQDAVCMRLQQILECAIKLSPHSKSKLKIDWSSLTAMRNKISHSYVDVEAEIIWEVIDDFEEFKKLIKWAQANV
jgi:uncharacterized protein with HEPN domain